MNAIIYALFIVLPYISLTILVGGVIYRVLRWASTPKGRDGLYLGLYRVVNRAGQRSCWAAAGHILARMLTFYTIPKNSHGRDYGTWLGVLLFHWGIFLLIVFHLHLWMPWLMVGERTMFVTGTATGAITLVAGLFLLARRMGLRRIYGLAMNALDDYVAITWVVLIVVVGLALRIFEGSNLMEGAMAWATGLSSLRPVPPPAVPLFYVHVILVELFMIYLPFSKMIHPFTFPVNPVLYGRFEDVEEVERKVEEALGW